MLRLPRERGKYEMLGGSVVVVGRSITSYDLMHHGAVAVRCRAPAPSEPSHHSVTLHATSPVYNSELRLPRERVKYAMLGSSEVVDGTSIASYDLMHAAWCCGGPLPRPRPSEPSHHSMTLHATSKVILCLDCPESALSTRCLVAL